MKILIACEESQTACKEFRKLGHEAQKTTCLWIKGLPLLKPTNIVGKGEFTTFKSGKKHPKWYAEALKLSPSERSRIRSQTFPGVAKAMAEQWGTSQIK